MLQKTLLWNGCFVAAITLAVWTYLKIQLGFTLSVMKIN